AGPRRLGGDPELQPLVRRVRRRRAQIVVPPRAPQQWTGHADLLRQLARDHPDALGAREKERVVFEHRLVLAEPLLDTVERLATLLRPAGRQVVPRAAGLMKTIEQPRTGQRLEKIQK